MTRAEIYTSLTEVFQDVFMRDIEVTPALTAQQVPGWDSLKQIEIVIAVQQKFHIKLHTREVDQFTCVGDLADAVARKTGSGMTHG
jgi:acyl carrier protein